MPKSRPTSSVSIASGSPAFGRTGRVFRIGSRASRLARVTKQSRTTHQLTTTIPDVMGSSIGHGSKSWSRPNHSNRLNFLLAGRNYRLRWLVLEPGGYEAARVHHAETVARQFR